MLTSGALLFHFSTFSARLSLILALLTKRVCDEFRRKHVAICSHQLQRQRDNLIITANTTPHLHLINGVEKSSQLSEWVQPTHKSPLST